MDLPHTAYAYVLRSPYVHARIAGIGKSAALAMPGVFAVLSGENAAQDKLIDALAPLGVKDLPLPATPENIWRAIRAAAR